MSILPVIEAENMYKVFGRGANRAVERLKDGTSRDDLRAEGTTAAVIDASFTVESGEIFVVMGLSGSGKSTLIRMVNGLLPATAGTLEIAGQDVSEMTATNMRSLRREKISMVFQHFALLPHRTVGENAAYALEVKGMSKSDRQERAEEALEMVGLSGWGGSYPGQLSGGMQQRVGLARALAAETEILLMDEAFSALDPLIRREMQDQLVELQDKLDKTILFITHDLNEAMRLGDRVAMMRDGRIVQIGSSEQILNDPANDYVAQFIQDVDRSRVLTASSVMERPVTTMGSEQGPRSAHRLFREHQLPTLLVVDPDRTLRGQLVDSEVSEAVQQGQDNLDTVLDRNVTTVTPDTLLADLLNLAADAAGPVPVVNESNRLLGVVPRVTLLNALGGSWDVDTPEPPDVDQVDPSDESGETTEVAQ